MIRQRKPRKKKTINRLTQNQRQNYVYDYLQKIKQPNDLYTKLFRERENLRKRKRNDSKKIKRLRKRRKLDRKKIKKLDKKIEELRPKFDGFISRVCDDILIYICSFMDIPDLPNYFLICEYMYLLIGKNEFVWKDIAFRYVKAKRKTIKTKTIDEVNLTTGMVEKKTIRKMVTEICGPLEKKFIEELYKRRKTWKNVVYWINIKYSSIADHVIEYKSLFRQVEEARLKSAKNYKKMNSRGKIVLDMQKIRREVTERMRIEFGNPNTCSEYITIHNNMKDLKTKKLKKKKITADNIKNYIAKQREYKKLSNDKDLVRYMKDIETEDEDEDY